MERKKNKQPKLHIRKGDVVKIIAGNAKGQQGKVLSIDVKDRKAIVEGLNMVSKHARPNAASPNGGITKKEAPIHLSNLMLLDPASGTVTRIGRKLDETGSLVRYAKKSGEIIKASK